MCAANKTRGLARKSHLHQAPKFKRIFAEAESFAPEQWAATAKLGMPSLT
jgi:hypothetical protein